MEIWKKMRMMRWSFEIAHQLQHLYHRERKRGEAERKEEEKRTEQKRNKTWRKEERRKVARARRGRFERNNNTSLDTTSRDNASKVTNNFGHRNPKTEHRKRQPKTTTKKNQKSQEITKKKRSPGRREFTNELRNCTTAITIPLKAQSEPRGKAIEAAGRG